MNRLRSVATTALVVVVVWALPAAACSICFGDANSPITKSAEMGVWFLLAVILLVEGAFGLFFFVYFRRRTRSLREPMARPILRLVKKGV
jgi:hypothetical protein